MAPPESSARRPALLAALLGFALVAAALGVSAVQAAPAPAPVGSGPAPAASAPGNPPALLPGPTPSRSTPAIPPGALDLTNATLDLPTLPEDVAACQGRRSFAGGIARGSAPAPATVDATLRIEAEWVGEVDGDGTVDTLALVSCDIVDTTHNWQLIAVAGRSGDTVRTVGQVLASGRPAGPAVLFGLTVTGGVVSADVGDFLGDGDATAAQISARQRRGYRLADGGFRQVSGPVSFAPNPNFYDLAVTAGPLTFAPSSAGARAATLAVTVRNAGPAAATDVHVTLTFPAAAEPDGDAWSACGDSGDIGPFRTVVCPLGPLAPREARSLGYAFVAPADADVTAGPPGSVRASGTDHLGLGYALDTADANDTAPLAVRLATF